jgi:hypothetical protein
VVQMSQIQYSKDLQTTREAPIVVVAVFGWLVEKRACSCFAGPALLWRLTIWTILQHWDLYQVLQGLALPDRRVCNVRRCSLCLRSGHRERLSAVSYFDDAGWPARRLL